MQVLFSNMPYMAMIVLGAAVFVLGAMGSLAMSVAAAVYVLYGLGGSVWIMIFVCPYCRYYDTHSCPCGYGTIAARLRPRKAADCFNEKFKKHIPVIVPLWFLPILAGVPFLIRDFSWPLLFLLLVFATDAFILLPLFSVKHGCTECPQKQTCPWMRKKAATE